VSSVLTLLVCCSTNDVSVSPNATGLRTAALPGGTVTPVENIAQLVAGRNMVMGQLKVWNDKTDLYVKFTAGQMWAVKQVQFHIALSPAQIPQTKKGNPIPGKFANKKEYAIGVTTDTYKIPLTWAVETQIFIAFHADVEKMDLDNVVVQSEGAWAKGDQFPGSNWAMFFPDIVDKGLFIIINPPKK